MSITLQSPDHARNILRIDYGITDTDSFFNMICTELGIIPNINDIEIWEVILVTANDLLDKVKIEDVENTPIISDIPVIKKDFSKTSRENSLLAVEKRQVKPEDKKLLTERWKPNKSRSANKFNKNKNIENVSVKDISYTKYQETIATSGYLYNLDRRYAIKVTESLAIIFLDKKLGTEYTIGDFISLHPSYTVIPRSDWFKLSLLLQCEIQQWFSDLKSDHNPKMVDLKYWLQFKDCIQAKIVIANASDKMREEKFNDWYLTQNYTSLKNWIKRQAKKGICCQDWYIKTEDNKKIIDRKRILDIWEEANI